MQTDFDVTLEQVKDYKFTVAFDDESLQPMTMDEPAPIGTGLGPNSSRVLAAAIGHCMSASLFFCLNKAHIPLKRVSTRVHATLARNEAGRWRVQSIKVNISADPLDEADREKMRRCVEIFEDFCVVTQSVRKGIDVQIALQAT